MPRMKTVKVSVICTLKDEERLIREFLDSLLSQSKRPDEIIIVDGGSSDRTVAIIRSYIRKGAQIRLIVQKNANIAKGRNIAVRNARWEIIASTDGGCRLSRNWLRNLVRPFEKGNVDVVSGVYAPWYENQFEEIASHMVFADIKKLNQDKFLPSGRSIAFTKEAWSVAGGYPEWLDTAEDTFFDLKLREHGMKFLLAQDAIVYWRVRRNGREIFDQFYRYATGDGRAFLFPNRYLTRYLVIALLFILGIEYWSNVLFWSASYLLALAVFWAKYVRKVSRPSYKRFIVALSIAFAIESGLFFGYFGGILTRLRDHSSSNFN
jgi:glycosyltransferase involved in cell wall biosynthesis